MLVSMTGHGQSSVENEHLDAHVEIRTINNRFLKVTMGSDLPAELQANIEETIRQRVSRGTVNVRIQLVRHLDQSQYQINAAVLKGYLQQLAQAGFGETPSLGTLLVLPGVVSEGQTLGETAQVWPVLQGAIQEALQRLDDMRRAEGKAMAINLQDNLRQLEECITRVEQLAPKVVEQFSQRLTERINHLLQKYDLSIQPGDIVREIGIFAERADVAEELVRLRSHCELFSKTMDSRESNGRKLDFVVQEMLRETNTIGSKCGDADLASIVVEMKTIIERMREMVQNVE